jgi:hypothetical protein
MIKNFVFVFLAILTTGFVNAQSNLLNSKTVKQIGVKMIEIFYGLKWFGNL